MIETRLELIAAKAKQLAEDYKKLWPGDLTLGLNEIEKQIRMIRSEKRDSDPWDR